MSKPILYEPWGLGDAVIAARVASLRPGKYRLACQKKWHSLLEDIFDNKIDFEAVEPAYTERDRNSAFDFSGTTSNTILDRTSIPLYSIRGDIRDWMGAKKLFPNSQRTFTGWFAFFARRISILDFPFHFGIFEIRNRYQAWAKLLKIDWNEVIQDQQEKITSFKARQENLDPSSLPVSIHIGAQWKSRQYPHVLELVKKMKEKGIHYQILAGPKDSLPYEVNENLVLRCQGSELLEAIQKSKLFLTNDSGPMHVASAVGCPTFGIARVTQIQEWLPPLGNSIKSPKMPKGYAPDSRYASDAIIEEWPNPDEITDYLLKKF